MPDIRVRYVVDSSQITEAHKAMSGLSDEEKESIAEFKKLNSEAKKAGETIEDTGKKGKNSMGGMGDTVKSVGASIAAAFSIAAIAEFTMKVITITSEFQKYSAVLANTLGSQQASDIAMAMIGEQAKKTNFSVQELTDTYIKFANRGLQLTADQITKLADLANSTGKGIDQLTEAMLDAFTGENERLKEFGITAKKTGETTQYTFKGITTEVKNSQAAIQEYLFTLGDLKGVAGSTDKIVATLGGQISNLGDSFDQLLVTMGNGGKGFFFDIISGATMAIDAVNRLMKSNLQLEEEADLKELGQQQGIIATELAALVEGYTALGQSQDVAKQTAITKMFTESATELNRLTFETEAYTQKYKDLKSFTDGGLDTLLAEQEATGKKLRIEQQRYDLLLKMISPVEAEKVRSLGLLEALEKKLKDLGVAQKQAFSKEEIQRYEKEIEHTKDLIADLFRERSKPLDQIENTGDIITDEENNAAQVLDINKRLAKDLKEVNKDQDEDYHKRLQDNFEYFKMVEERKKELQMDLAITIADGLFQLQAQQNQEALANNEAARAQELKRVGDDKQAQAFINAKFDRQSAALKTKQATADKAQALFGIGLNTALAIVKQLAATPLPVGAPLIALIAAMGAVQFAVAAAKPIPKFARGTEFVDGPGTSTSDSIMARLSVGERVVPAGINRQLAGIPNADLPKLMSMNYDALTRQAKAQTDNALMEELKGLRKDIKRIPINQINMDKKGFTTFIRQGDSITEVLNNQFSR